MTALVQDVIDGNLTGAEAPPVEVQCPADWAGIVRDILDLNRLAVQMHNDRFDQGALRLDRIKLLFCLDDHGMPSTVSLQSMGERSIMRRLPGSKVDVTVCSQRYGLGAGLCLGSYLRVGLQTSAGGGTGDCALRSVRMYLGALCPLCGQAFLNAARL